ncbi:5'-methylthioadenosine/adenosylhomocysteine nucleosidase [Salipaludibacillus agaradhaerens]|uniref:adenosylhomocysteine nucleosidase n=1 Tax=Salipaludibacillus agaradhaerens TaxID=76935 RepID=A0A9Q4AZ84_SALAG|nr:5'-methylthioadenosine/adenosylhomocysteine nucleosidase [Salipaludibacillus agaradhaerens]MCR6095497.1 5'-methylthioadenosine/adenosylhomocysteine nucleosidase [Salipaludibacillus agaradhaerens]MCR6114943.1 5'-methylthioadenosine/adenosylhomocysteine nucleosidase [Salipaludibacillus agaradhaerens]
MTIGIIGAMDEEVLYFRKRMVDFESISHGKQTFYKGRWHGHETIVVKCGVGKVNAAMVSQMLIDVYNVDKLIFTGVAGAVNPELNVGDILISQSCQQHDIEATALGFSQGVIPMYDGPSVFQADPTLLNIAYSAANELAKKMEKAVLKGKVVSGDQFISDPSQVTLLREMFTADCVEMEGAAVAHVADFNHIPFVIIRSISDKADGKASGDFQTFMAEAAQTSAEIVSHMLELKL